MAKQKIDGFHLLLTAAILGCFSVFLVNTFCVNRHFSKKYNVGEADIRVSDTGNILRFAPILLTFVGIVIIACIVAGQLLESLKNGNSPLLVYTLSGIIIAAVFLLAFAISARLGTTQIGMVIFRKKDMLVIPADYNKNTLVENVFGGKLFTSMFAMEELPLSGLRKITRQSGRKAFLHGTFGTRCVAWRNKQKRDECIAALERASSRRMGGIDMDD